VRVRSLGIFHLLQEIEVFFLELSVALLAYGWAGQVYLLLQRSGVKLFLGEEVSWVAPSTVDLSLLLRRMHVVFV